MSVDGLSEKIDFSDKIYCFSLSLKWNNEEIKFLEKNRLRVSSDSRSVREPHAQTHVD
ncbi:hypothetical protein HAX54_037946, partial [Datura stramonium]|nr:hypothetical protein [Datura stramonium]